MRRILIDVLYVAVGWMSIAALFSLLVGPGGPNAGTPATRAALATVRQAETQLAMGDSTGVDDELARAEQSLSGQTLTEVEAARAALARQQFSPAGTYLAGALKAAR